jgi:hypothetical protein
MFSHLLLVKTYKMKIVQNGDSVKVNYTGRLEDGSVFDSSLTAGREPLAAVLGQGQLIKGFESVQKHETGLECDQLLSKKLRIKIATEVGTWLSSPLLCF